jgi:hypothetical protein
VSIGEAPQITKSARASGGDLEVVEEDLGVGLRPRTDAAARDGVELLLEARGTSR